MNMQSRSKEARVKGNCHTVQLAAEDFSVQNDGVYAADLGTALPATGETLIGLLPGGRLLENPFTRLATEPIVGAAATVGQTGYSSVDPDGDGNPDGYAVTGFGENAAHPHGHQRPVASSAPGWHSRCKVPSPRGTAAASRGSGAARRPVSGRRRRDSGQGRRRASAGEGSWRRRRARTHRRPARSTD